MRKIKNCLFYIACIHMFIVLSGIPVYAGDARIQNIDKTILVNEIGTSKSFSKNIDLDGDGKPENLYVSCPSYNRLTIRINGVDAHVPQPEYCGSVQLKLCVLKNGKRYVFIDVGEIAVESSLCSMYEYKNGRLTEVFNFLKQFPNTIGVGQAELLSASGNTIKYKTIIFNGVMRYCYVTYKLIYKKGKLCLSSNIGALTNINKFHTKKYYRLTKTIRGYKKPKSKKATIKLKKGTKAKIQKMYTNGKITRFKLKLKSGKTVWVNGSKKITKDSMRYPLFNATNPAG